ncbi:hypothetical protein LTR96_000191 [Exophiala xenobiotica]|nr:hypothetical protein H2202_005898 [Exophiala xenobiotica]KAK5209400.1 hypothetical protein LTR41_004936 [Exophiala xenobiotica]KAK5223816.1 hypothetical protein LTR72_005202 [Exophiala xenobiotica]KAK5236507.1 hypothetical protein LTR47_002458 [Exophiala xenobiotica]KAK5252265.1 hypothetical protein LTS06_003132 [Exophiala xenobiotica]
MATNMDGEKIDPVTEKPSVQATVTSVNDDPCSLESDTVRPSRDLRSAIYTIVGGVALPCIPIIVVSAVLLYFIFKHRVVPRAGWTELYVPTDHPEKISNITNFIKEIRHNGGRPAYYVAYNPSTITTIAAWTGRVIPYLSSSIMALVAFFAARHIVLKSKHGHHTELPTPEQLTLLISLLGGSGFSPLKDTIFYRWGRKERLVAPLPAAFTALFIITLLGVFIPIIDTWFGIAVHPATITQLYNTSASAYHSFGRKLDPGTTDYSICPNGPGFAAGQTGNPDQHWYWPCNLYISTPHPQNIFLVGGEAASKLQLNQPTNDMISNYTGSLSSSASKHNETVYFYSDARSSNAVDFKAQTLGISTQCHIASQRCHADYSNGTSFRCSAGFAGDLSECMPNVWPASGEYGTCDTGIGFATDAKLSQAAGMNNLTDMTGSATGYLPDLLKQNPMYFGTWASGFPGDDIKNALFANMDPQVFPGGAVTAAWMLNCTSTVYDVTYTYSDGSLHSFDATVAAPEWGAFFSAPFSWSTTGILGMKQASLALENAAYLASYTANTSTQMANIWANEFSRAALELSVGVFTARVNDLEQLRNSSVSVARIPLVPLYLLLGFKFVYVVVVIILAIGAYCFTHPAETEIVKAQLSVKGLAAAHFDQPDLIRQDVVKQVQSRLEQAKNGGGGGGNAMMTTEQREQEQADAADAGSAPIQPLKRAATAPAGSGPNDGEAEAGGGQGADADHKPKIGLMPTRAGTWQFVLLANGAWQSVKPIVQSFVLSEAKTGEFGTAGDIYAAWK